MINVKSLLHQPKDLEAINPLNEEELQRIEAQYFLPKLGNNNQFIITTHSDYVEQLVPEAQLARLEV